MKMKWFITIVTLCAYIFLGYYFHTLDKEKDELWKQVNALKARTNALVEINRSTIMIVDDIDNWVEKQKQEQKQIKSRKERCGNEKESGGDSTGKTGKHAVPKKGADKSGRTLGPAPAGAKAEGG